jgi:hypothetical protein
MDTSEFLQRVLPVEGMYCAWTKTGRGRRQRFFDTIDELVHEVQERDHLQQNTFFAISTFLDDSNRKKTNVKATKVVALDIDCGPEKPFADYKAGLKAFSIFATKMGLPRPMLVKSGNGIHVYWILDHAIPPSEWSAIAHAMKDAAAAEQFAIDAGPTANPSLVLRPVGTNNWKDPDNPRAVEVLLDAEDVSAEALKSALSYYYKPAMPKTRNSALMDSLAVKSEFPPAVASVVADKCQQIKWAIDNPEHVAEPMWYALIGVAAHTTDPEDTARRWSEGHSKYSESETLAKLRQWKAQSIGPTTCARIESERAGGCAGCPFAGQIGSPVRLGSQFEEAEAPAEEVAAELQGTVPIPKPFKHIKGGGVAISIDDADTRLTDFDIHPLSYGYDEALGYEVVQYLWNRPHVGWKVLTFRQGYLTDSALKEFTGAVADQGIVLETRKQTELFQIMLRSYMNELRKMRTVTNLYSTMGWKEDNNVFVVGDTLLRRGADGVVTEETIRLSAHTQRVGSDMFTVDGDFEVWKQGTALLEKGELYAHMFSIGVGLASVLVPFTGLKGVTVSLYGESGGGKSLAQLMQQSLWGHPDKLHMQSKFTQNGLFTRFATHGNLPMTIDEATQMSDDDVADYLYTVTQGRDKARLDKNSAEKAPREWALTCTVSTNKPMAAKLASMGNQTEAQLARLLELRVDKSALFHESTDLGRRLHALFVGNHGWAGREVVKSLMVMGPEGLRAAIDHAVSTFGQRYNKKFSGVERFWELVFVLTDFALRFAYERDIIRFDPTLCVEWALQQVDDMRDTMRDNEKDAFDLIAEYANEFAGNTVRVYYNPDSDPYSDAKLLPRGPVRLRIEVYRAKGAQGPTSGVLYLDRAHFRKWFAARGENPREMVTLLNSERANMTPKSQKASLGKNTALSIPQTYVIGVDITHPRMASILTNAEDSYSGAPSGLDSLGDSVHKALH